MKRYQMRELIHLTADELWSLPAERHIVVFDDGEIESHTRATIVSTYLSYPLTAYPETPVLKKHHLGERVVTGGVILETLNTVIWDIHAHYNETPDTEHLAKLCIQATNRLYNDATVKASASVATLSIFDVYEVLEHPVIKKANAEVEPTHYSIEKKTYPVIKGVLSDDHSLRGNALKEAARAGTLKMGQLMQVVGPLGYRTDINSDIFPEPITKGFAEGVGSLYGAMIESRSGAKSLLYNKELLRETEYFNRKTQLAAQYVQRLHYGKDCGTQYLINFHVSEDSLKALKGKYYLRDDGSLDWIRGNETDLVGSVIKIRSVLGCMHPDPAGICSICYGRMTFSIPRNTNIGHVSAVVVGDKITSSVLSTKHLDASSTVEKFHLDVKEQKYLQYGEEPETLYLKKKYKGKRMWLTVSRSEAENLADIMMVPSLKEYPVSSASQITQLLIQIDNGSDGIESEILKVSLYNRKSSFSRELLEHIREHKWAHDDAGDICIELTGFDVKRPFLTLPFKHVNMYEVMLKIKSFLHSGTDTDNKKLGGFYRIQRGQRNFLKNYTDPVEALHVFSLMLNEKLYVNLVHCEILLYAMMVVSSQQRDYRLPIPGISGMFEKYNNLMNLRSMAAAMAYEKQDKPLMGASAFIHRHRIDHPYDLLLMGGQISR